nr:hypothetical protein [Tanacetum cinerariifolium]
MNDAKPVVKQVEELQIIVHEIEVEGMGATKHIFNSRRMFVSYQKDLLLSNVLHVSNITKNMISGLILSNKGFTVVFESDTFIITKGGVYVEKGYLDEGLFKLSVVTDDNVINNKNTRTSTASM